MQQVFQVALVLDVEVAQIVLLHLRIRVAYCELVDVLLRYLGVDAAVVRVCVVEALRLLVGAASAVIAPPLLRVAQQRVGLLQRLEARDGLRRGVLVRVHLERQPVVGLPDLRGAGGGFDTE